MADEPGEIHEDGVLWKGSHESLEAWKEYKRQKAMKFVQRGYSVEWTPDGYGFMAVYLPERHYAKKPEIRATVRFFDQPSKYGIDRGKISKLTIQLRRTDVLKAAIGAPHERIETLYNYDRGEDVDRLNESHVARRLFDAIYDELN